VGGASLSERITSSKHNLSGAPCGKKDLLAGEITNNKSGPVHLPVSISSIICDSLNGKGEEYDRALLNNPVREADDRKTAGDSGASSFFFFANILVLLFMTKPH